MNQNKRICCPVGFVKASVVVVVLAVVCLWSAQGQARRKPKISGVININTATIEQLTLLPRIGPKTARRILRYRKKQLFKSPRQITRVRGIGYKTYRRMAEFITTSQPTKFRVKSSSRKRRTHRKKRSTRK